MNIKKFFMSIITLVVLFNVVLSACSYGQTESVVPKSAEQLTLLKKPFNFIIANDLGRNGYYDQKPVAEMMGVVATITGPDFVATLGDVHHFNGVESVNDPLWQTNFEWIYKHPKLMIPWYPVLGNHEYRGNTQAVLDYSKTSRRWEFHDRYYAKTKSISKNVDVLMVFIDTPTLIDKYRKNPKTFPDAEKQSMEKQLGWIDSTLSVSDAGWKIVMGHHPVYAGTYKSKSERTDLQTRLKPILDKYKVDFSVCGHIHNFQHVRVTNSDVDYFVNSSASLTRKVDDFDGTLFGSTDSGFSICTVRETELIMTFVNKEGEIIYQYIRRK